MSNFKKKTIDTEILLEFCLKKKKALTPSRSLIIKTLSKHLKPQSAYELQNEINRSKKNNINISTIYRVLEFWIKLGLIHKISSLNKYFEEIKKGLENLGLKTLPKIICEPGRALVAESGSTIVRVNLRKKQKLYINEGTYGTLFDAGTPNIVFPSKMIKDTSNKIISKKITAFDFYGPTCDSMDYMKGPFLLPNNIKENDYIELGQLGAYGLTFRTQFNGFYSDEIYEVEDDPIISLYNKDANKATLVA